MTYRFVGTVDGMPRWSVSSAGSGMFLTREHQSSHLGLGAGLAEHQFRHDSLPFVASDGVPILFLVVRLAPANNSAHLATQEPSVCRRRPASGHLAEGLPLPILQHPATTVAGDLHWIARGRCRDCGDRRVTADETPGPRQVHHPEVRDLIDFARDGHDSAGCRGGTTQDMVTGGRRERVPTGGHDGKAAPSPGHSDIKEPAWRVGVLATYPGAVARYFVSFLGEFGVEVLDLRWLDAPSGWDAALFDADLIAESAAKLSADGMQAILIPDTALPSLHFVEALEQRLGLPVLTANAVTLWDAQRIAGRHVPVPGKGLLLGGRGG